MRNMSGMDIDALETSFDLVAPKGDELMEIFYSNLFAVAPSVMPLFEGSDMARQRAMLLSALVLLRKSLRTLDTAVPTLKRLGGRHVAYGARPEHYPVVGEVLIGAMAQIAGDAWEPRFADAWAAAIGIVAGAMLEGAAEAELALAA
jgi:nitric oxide dioxygenase